MNKDQIAHFHRRGYVVIPHYLSPSEVALLVEECDSLVNHCAQDADLVEDFGCVMEPLNVGLVDIAKCDQSRIKHDPVIYRRYRAQVSDDMVPDILLDKMACLAAAVLPQERGIFLLNEQYIVKPPFQGQETTFGWHQDGQYLPTDFQGEPTLACWVALDTVGFQNGSVVVDPYPESPTGANTGIAPTLLTHLDTYRHHHQTAAQRYPPAPPLLSASGPSNPDTGLDQITMDPGSVLVMSSLLRHASPPNSGSTLRRCWMPQYCCRPLLTPCTQPLNVIYKSPSHTNGNTKDSQSESPSRAGSDGTQCAQSYPSSETTTLVAWAVPALQL
ncbi:hypothetical protein IWQ62_001930 [Dispira parvispora]|uniref:Phytanoyl-CoA dioxygenase family protein n=1 Tax=Dispira parvispora TaxID=1520584 RepID=A0A9W8ATW7_9FUNG|nr:hypothetical protein IWQ62_001930 [Dispira parvispora]